MKPFCILLAIVALFALPALSVAAPAPACPDGKCTYQSPGLVTVQVSAEVAGVAAEVARRSVGVVRAVARAPGKIVAVVRSREHKPVLKAVGAVKHRVGRHRCARPFDADPAGSF